MSEEQWVTNQFEANRDHLRSVAYRMLGSGTDADDAVQETWLRLRNADAQGIDNLGGWLTTVTARVCLDMLRSRKTRREDPLGLQVPSTGAVSPEDQVLMADSVGLALLVVLETLNPLERVSFVLHDLFDISFEEIGPIVGRTPTAARQLASRARRRVKGASVSQADKKRHRALVDAFIGAAKNGDFEALIAVLAPDAVVRADAFAVKLGAEPESVGAIAVAKTFVGRAAAAQRAVVGGLAGVVWAPRGKVRVAFRFTFSNNKISGIDLVGDPEEIARLEPAIIEQ